MKLKTIHCSTPAQKCFTITNPCKIATAHLEEVFINYCLNTEGKKKPAEAQRQRQITQQQEEKCVLMHKG
jgi:hypothetical protein